MGPTRFAPPTPLSPTATLLLVVLLDACGPEPLESFPSEDPRGDEAMARASPGLETAVTSTPLDEDFSTYDTGLWWKATGYGNGGVFNVGWRADHAQHANGLLTLTLDPTGCPDLCWGSPYASSEVRSLNSYGHGLFQVRMRAASGSGLVSSFFLYDDTSGDEIALEFLGKDTTVMQLNYFKGGVGGHETLIPLGFDAAEGDHTYGFSWTAEGIAWFVDGVKVHGEYGARGPLPTHPGSIMMNLWTGTGIDSWTGPFQYREPSTASYDWVSWGTN